MDSFWTQKISQIIAGPVLGADAAGNRLASTIVAVLLLISASLAHALTPEELFEKVAPSIVVVQIFDASSKQTALGSGVVVGREEVVTNCHVVLASDSILVVSGDRRFAAVLRFADIDHDLCLLLVSGLNGTPVKYGALRFLKPGTRVFAIGSPRGLELTISDGLVSGLRPIENSHLIQTSAPISGGSSGGGLFDVSGRLVGITSFTLVESQNLNFALPVDWVIQMQQRKAEGNRLVASQKAAIADRAPPLSSFPSTESAKSWLGEMDKRLVPSIPDPQSRNEFLGAIHHEAVRAGLDPQLVLALVDNLSNFHKYKISSNGARGYMQVMPTWVSRIGAPNHNLFHARLNLRYGCVILRHYLDQNRGDYLKALKAYQNQTLGRPESFVAVDALPFANEVLSLWKGKWQYDDKPR